MTIRIQTYDTTLRDGAQGEGVSFSLDDKLRVAHKLDEFGLDYIEGGWPASNPKDIAFFAALRQHPLRHARACAFGSTCKPHLAAGDDPQVCMLLEAGTPVVTIFGKSWDFHVTHALKVSLAENLRMIRETVQFLAERVPEVIYDAEHFFDGYKRNPAYAMETLRAAREAGASLITLCDTNGGTLPHEVEEIVAAVAQAIEAPLGIHTHDDSGCAVANSLAAIRSGAIHVQGTINGLGERCGNANLCTVVANLRLKMGYDCLHEHSLEHLTGLSQYVDEVANLTPNHRLPFVGRSAFAHKGGVHVDAVLKHRSTYEHVDPEEVGNTRRMLISELSGSSTVVSKAAKHAVDLTKRSPETRALLRKVTELERDGYSFEGAEASFELLLMQTVGTYRKLFDVLALRVIVEQRGGGESTTEATIKVRVGEEERLTVAEGDGPIHALDSALRKALQEFYPELSTIRLTDFKVRVVNLMEGTAAKVRTIIDSSDGEDLWSTVGVSTNMIIASWHALVDSVVYGLLRERIPTDSNTQPENEGA